jgi:hypothetical protein
MPKEAPLTIPYAVVACATIGYDPGQETRVAESLGPQLRMGRCNNPDPGIGCAAGEG